MKDHTSSTHRYTDSTKHINNSQTHKKKSEFAHTLINRQHQTLTHRYTHMTHNITSTHRSTRSTQHINQMEIHTGFTTQRKHTDGHTEHNHTQIHCCGMWDQLTPDPPPPSRCGGGDGSRQQRRAVRPVEICATCALS